MANNMKPMRIAALIVAMAALPAQAGEREDLENLRGTTLNLIRLLVREGILTQDKAETLMKEAEKRSPPDPVGAVAGAAAGTAAAGTGTVRVPYIPEVVKQEIRDELKQEVLAQAKAERWGDSGALPEWIERIKWEGDLRYRYQKDNYQPTNIDLASYQALTGNLTVDNTQFDRTRSLLRARLGVGIKLSDAWSAAIRIATGTTNSPVSTNQTLGNGLNKNSLWLDQAYIRFQPNDAVDIAAGRMPNPFFSTDTIWNGDLNFDGIAGAWKPKLSDTVRSFFTVGAFPLANSSPSPQFTSPQSKTLYGAQMGLDWAISYNTKAKIGLAVYDFQNYEGKPNTPGSTFYDATQPPSKQKGNTLFNITNPPVSLDTDVYALLSKFKPVSLTGLLDFSNWSPTHLTLTGDVIKNMGFDSAEIRKRTGINWQGRTLAYSARATLGHPRLEKRHDWQTYIAYKYLQRDSLVDAFNDSDFHLGGTDAKGFVLGGSYGLDKNTWMTLRWLSANAIDGPPLAIDSLQLDLNVRF